MTTLVPPPDAAEALPGGATALRDLLGRGLEAEITDLRTIHAWKRLVELGTFVLTWIAGGAMALIADSSLTGAARYAGIAAGILMAAVGINAINLVQHEGMHAILFRSRHWNRWVSVACGASVLMSFTAYRVMHTLHHRFLGDPRDPDDYNNYTGNRRVVWALHYMRLTIGCFLYVFLIPFLAIRKATPEKRRHIVTEYALLLALYAAILAWVPSRVLVLTWWLPLLVVAFMVQIRGFTQHGITDSTNPLLASRSLEVKPVVAFFLLHENYHLEHHLFPEIPSYNLARLHALVWPRIPHVVTGKSYLGFVARFVRASIRMDDTPIGLQTLSKRG